MQSPLFAFALVAFLTGCSTKGWYDLVVSQTEKTCGSIADKDARSQCIRTPPKTYESYTSDREALKAGKAESPQSPITIAP